MPRALRDAAAAPAVPGDDDHLARQKHVRGAHDAVQGGLAGAVSVVEKMFGERVVDRHDRILEDAFLFHTAQPDDAGGGLFGPADDRRQLRWVLRQNCRDEIAAIVHRELRIGRDDRFDVRVVALVVLTFDGEDLALMILDERGRDVVLRGERITCAERDFRAAGAQRDHKVGGLGGDVETRTESQAREGTLLGEPLAHRREYRHALRRPRDATPAELGQSNVLDVVGGRGQAFLRGRQLLSPPV